MSGYAYTALLDELEVDVLRVQVSHGHRVKSHEFPKRDGAEGEAGGREPWVANVELLFFDRLDEPEGAFYDRWLEFLSIVDVRGVHTFVHPYEGAVRGWISELDHDADGETIEIRARFVFTEDIALEPVFAASAGIQVRAGAQDVRAGAQLAEQAIDDVEDLDAEQAAAARAVLSDTSATVDAWESEPGITSRRVQLELATLNSQIATTMEDLELATTLSRHPIHRQLVLLLHTVRRAAESFTATDSRVTTITVLQPRPLRSVAAEYYGASDAERRVAELRELNPAIAGAVLLPAGTRLKAYAGFRRGAP